jgi:5,10-methylenetetrahydromethanopterin reductase
VADLTLSCSFPPGPDVVEHIQQAEALGYQRAWLYDSPALYPDVWVTLADVARETSTIGLGVAVLVPSLRNAVTQAAAVATLAQRAPGRLAVAVGTGFTGRMVLGQRPLSWKTTGAYVRQLKGLLAGEEVDIDGHVAKLIHPDGYVASRPVDVPVLVAANGPLGLAVAEELGDGVVVIGSLGVVPTGFDWVTAFTFGTVLDHGEDAGSERAVAAAGPALTALLHGMVESGSSAIIETLPGGAEWLAQLDAVPEDRRHLSLHEDHMLRVTERDAPLVSGDLLQAFTWTGTPDEVKAKAAAFAAGGGTEVMYAPHGPDMARELEAFQAALR